MTTVNCNNKLSEHFAAQGGILIRPKNWERQDCVYCALIEGYAFVYYSDQLDIYAPEEFDVIGVGRENIL